MAEYIPKILERGFQNWLKANLALNITKDGIEYAVLNEMNTFHQHVLNVILTPEQIINKDFCKQCSKENIIQCPTRGTCVVKLGQCSFHHSQQKYYRPCPKQVCDRLRDQMKHCHRFNFPSWKNTTTEKWCENPWELAKCYLPPDGYIAINTIAETDLNGILSLIMNHAVFKKKINEKACEEVRDISRIIRHSPHLSIDENDLNTFLDSLVTFFDSSSLFQADFKAAASVKKIKMLKAECLTITTRDVTQVLLDVIQENTRGSLEQINKTTAQQLVGVKSDIDKLKVIASQSLKDILTAKETAISDIGITKDTAIKEFRSAAQQMKSDVNKDIEKKQFKAVAKVRSITEKSTETAKDELKSSIEEMKSDLKENLEKTKLTAVAHIQTYAEKSTKTAKEELKLSAEGLKSDMKETLEKNKLTAVAHIQSFLEKGTGTAKGELESSAEKLKSNMKEELKKKKINAVEYIQSYTEKSKNSAKEDLKSSAERLRSNMKEDLEKAHAQLVAEGFMKHIEQSSIPEIKKAAINIKVPLQHLTEADYQRLQSELKEDLLTFNRANHSTIPLSPLIGEDNSKLTGFYVMPALSSVEVQKTEFRGPGSEVKVPVPDLKGVFFKRSNQCKNVILTSEAGHGKTAFCKRLALTWCNAHQINTTEIGGFSDEDLNVVREFDYLFLIPLRDSLASDCDIDDMIQNQIIQYLSRSYRYSENFMQTILHRESSLVILDGLDEWSHPEQKHSACRRKPEYIPHRKIREKCTIMTSTRPWKLSIATLKSSEIDNHIEIGNLEYKGSKQLMRHTFTKIKGNRNIPGDLERNIEAINTEMRSGSFEEFKGNPMLITYLICLWCDGKPFGQSRCEVYSNILDLLLLRAKENNTRIVKTDFALNDKDSPALPICFETRTHVKSCYKFLISLSQLAFQTLFNKNKERSLVFDCTSIDSILTPDAYQLSLCSGLLTQSKVPGKLASRDTRVSFSHKTFQEFFAALYIQSESDLTGISEQVLERCNTVETILEMSNVFIFLSGLGPKKVSFVFEKLRHCVNEDEMTIKYRQEYYGSISHYQIFKDIQSMCIACFKENKNSYCDSFNIVLQDIIIDKDTESYSHLLQCLVVMNIKNIKSVQYRHSASEEATREIIRSFHLKEIHTFEMLLLVCPIRHDDLETLLAGSVNTLKHITIDGSIWQDGRYFGKFNTVSDVISSNLLINNQLDALILKYIEEYHCDIERLVSYITQRTSMTQLYLYRIKCIDHGETCRGLNMDLSQHSQLNTVGFRKVPLSHMKINTSALEKCTLGKLQMDSNLVSSFADNLPSASKLKHLTCIGLNSDLDLALKTIPLLVHLQRLSIRNSNMGNKCITLSPDMVDIHLLEISQTKMTSTSFRKLILDLKQLQQSVHVELRGCTVAPSEEYERLKKYIVLSKRFVVLYDGKSRDVVGQKFSAFVFETVSLKCAGNV